MQTALIFILFMLGIVALIKGGDLLVDSSLKVSEYTGISQVIIGVTLVSLATTMPELLVSTIAAVNGEQSIAVGNGIGSMICNTALVLGISLTAKPTFYQDKKHVFKMLYLIGSIFLITMFAISFKINLYQSIILIVLFLIFFVLNFIEAKKEVFAFKRSSKTKQKVSTKQILLLIFMFVLGGGLIFVGAQLMVANGSKIADLFGMSKELIAVTVFALGTSLPELITTITAIKKGAASLSLGNIIGANIINCTLLIGLSGVISNGISITTQTLYLSLPVLVASILIVALPILIKKRSYKWQGYALLALYLSYLITLITLAIVL